MSIRSSFANLGGALFAPCLVAIAAAQVPASPLEIKAIAEVESRSFGAGREVRKLAPAERVVPGDRVIYTLEVRNTGAAAVKAPSISYAIPEHMQYVADSAVGPGAEVSYSVDAGHSFGVADSLKVRAPDGRMRPALAADYTDIRWQLRSSLKPNSVAFVRFRALVK